MASRRPRSVSMLLLRNELRVTWRALESGSRPIRRLRRTRIPTPWVLVILLVAIGVFLGIPAARALADVELGPTPVFVVLADLTLLAIFPLMLSQTLVAAVNALYERGDLDLLLSSPVPARAVLTIRALGMAVNAGILFVMILLPFLIPMAIWGHPEWLGALVVAVAMALTATAVGLALALVLFRLIGPRRTRTVAQIVGAVAGAAFVIGFNIPNIIGGERADNLWLDITQRYAAGGAKELPMLLQLPARAVLGEPLPLLVVAGVAVALFALVSSIVGARFAEDSAAARGADTFRRRRAPSGGGEFGAGAFRAMMRKETRLLLRDPSLLSHVLLRVLYLLPLAFIVLRNASEDQALAVAFGAGGLAFLASQTAGSLAWITVSAEDAPALLAASPVPAQQVWRAKLAAALGALAIIVAVPLLALVALAPWAGLVAIVGCTLAALSSGLVHIWLQKPGKRKDFQRRDASSWVLTVIDIAVGAAWAAATGFAADGRALWAAGIAAAVALVVLALARRSEDAILERIAA